MAQQQISIPWNDGPGSIVLTLTGEGNDTVVVTSTTDCIDHARSQQVTFVVKDGAIHHEAVTADGHLIQTADGHIVNSLANTMKVTVMVTQPMTSHRLVVTQNDHIVVTASGNMVCVSN